MRLRLRRLRFAMPLLALLLMGCNWVWSVCYVQLHNYSMAATMFVFELTDDILADAGSDIVEPGDSQTMAIEARPGDLRNVHAKAFGQDSSGNWTVPLAEAEFDGNSLDGSLTLEEVDGEYQLTPGGFEPSWDEQKENPEWGGSASSGGGGGGGGGGGTCNEAAVVQCINNCGNMPINSQADAFCASACVYGCQIPCDGSMASICQTEAGKAQQMGTNCYYYCQ